MRWSRVLGLGARRWYVPENNPPVPVELRRRHQATLGEVRDIHKANTVDEQRDVASRIIARNLVHRGRAARRDQVVRKGAWLENRDWIYHRPARVGEHDQGSG